MKTSRRSFLGAGLALPALLEPAPSLASHAPEAAASKDSSFDPWVEIHRENLHHNVQEISRRVGSRPILAVIKNNGYGVGVTNVAQLLEPRTEIAGFAVVKFHEAMSLRDAGIRKPVLLMGPFDDRNLEDAVARGIMPMVYTPLGPVLDKIAVKLQKPAALHICVDTGIGRVGVPYYQAAPLIRDVAGRKSVQIQGIMMTFTEDAELDKEQIRRFQETCGAVEKEGVALGKKHAASSFSLFQHTESFFDMVRPGMAIYGVYSENEFRHTGVMDLRPALSLKARVAYVKKLRKGDSAGYNRAYTAQDDVWVATLPVGHADGWPRTAPKGAKVRINGNLYPVIAAVSASHCIVEIGKEERVKIGDPRDVFRLARRIAARGRFGSLRRLRLRPNHAPESPAAAAHLVRTISISGTPISPDAAPQKNCLTYSHMGMYCGFHASRRHHFGCLQRRRRAASPGNTELSRAARARCRGYCGDPSPGAALRLQAPARASRRRLGPRAARRPQDAVSNQRQGHPAAPRVGGHLRALLAASDESREGTRRGEDEGSPSGLAFKEERWSQQQQPLRI
jgi:alanine racemase